MTAAPKGVKVILLENLNVHFLDTHKESEKEMMTLMEDNGMAEMKSRFLPCCWYRK